MKKLLVLALAALGLVAIETKASAQFSIGAGSQFQNNLMMIDGVESTESNIAAYAGLAYTIGLKNGFGLTPGVYFSSIVGTPSNVLHRDQTITIPVLLSYGHDVCDWLNLGIAVGPTGVIPLGNSDLKHFNLGIGSSLIFTLADHIAFNASYDFTCLNRYNSSVTDNKLTTRKLCFGIAWLF